VHCYFWSISRYSTAPREAPIPAQPIPASSPPPAEPEVPMWQVLGLQPAVNTSPAAATADTTPEPAVQLPVVDDRSASPAGSDNSFTRITIKMEVDELGPKTVFDTVEIVEEIVDDLNELIVPAENQVSML